MNRFSSDINYLRQYVNGELTPTEMYEIERAMHEDEMLMDIIEGLETEKNLGLNSPVSEIKERIYLKSRKSTSNTFLTTRNLSIAASIIVILGIGVFYFYKSAPQQELVQIKPTETKSIITNKTEVNKSYPDSSLIVNLDTDIRVKPEEKTIKAYSINTVKKDSVSRPKLIAYNAKPKMTIVIERPKSKYKYNEEVISIGNPGYTELPKTEMLNAKVGSQPNMPSSSIAKTHADLQKMDLDPQTKANLALVLSRQTQESASISKDRQAETTIEEVFTGGNALAANKKATESAIQSATETYGAIASKPIQNGNPSIGWSEFNKYIKTQLTQKGVMKFNANISFDLDENSKPKNIKINSSTNTNLNKHIISILKQGPTWEGKNPDHPIFIRISSEEL